MLLFVDIDADVGFEFDGKAVRVDADLLNKLSDQRLIKLCEADFLLADELLQFANAVQGLLLAVALLDELFLKFL